MANTDAPISFVTQAADPLPALVQEDINASGTVYQLPIATYTAQPTMISDLQYVAHNIGAGTVSSFNGRTGAVTPQTGDYTGSQIKIPGYKQATSRQNVATTDTVTQAIGKMEYKINKAVIIKQLSLPAASWIGSESPYSQVITGLGTTANSKVDVQIDAAAYNTMVDSGTGAIYIANNNGIITVYALGEKPGTDITVQVSIVEVVTG